MRGNLWGFGRMFSKYTSNIGFRDRGCGYLLRTSPEKIIIIFFFSENYLAKIVLALCIFRRPDLQICLFKIILWNFQDAFCKGRYAAHILCRILSMNCINIVNWRVKWWYCLYSYLGFQCYQIYFPFHFDKIIQFDQNFSLTKISTLFLIF